MNKWTEQHNKLVKRFEFKDFSEAFEFMKLVAVLADKLDHHPNWSNSYNKVYLELNTHSAGGTLTEKDFELAKAIDNIIHE